MTFFFPFLKHPATPFLPDRKAHFISHKNAFLPIFCSSEVSEALLLHVGFLMWIDLLTWLWFITVLTFLILPTLGEIYTLLSFLISVVLPSAAISPNFVFNFMVGTIDNLQYPNQSAF